MRRTNDGTYRVDSASTPGVYYTVEYAEVSGPEGWQLRCDCPASAFGKRCWHIAAVAKEEAARHLGSAA